MRSFLLKISLYTALFALALTAFAQEKKIDVDINVGKQSNWYQQPWIWVVGAAVFILLLVALLRRRD